MVGLRELADRVMLTAVYDPDRARAEAFGRDNGFDRVCDSFEQLIDAVDAVIIAAPQQYHAPQAVFALDRNVHVLVEVPAAISMAQAESLLAAARKSSAVYMLAENYCYTRPNIVVDAMVHNGMFGHIYYGESEYLHEMRSYYTTATGEHPSIAHQFRAYVDLGPLPGGSQTASTRYPCAKRALGGAPGQNILD